MSRQREKCDRVERARANVEKTRFFCVLQLRIAFSLTLTHLFWLPKLVSLQLTYFVFLKKKRKKKRFFLAGLPFEV